MSNDPKSDQPSREVNRRFERTLRNLLNTPHKPHKAAQALSPEKRKALSKRSQPPKVRER